MKSTPKITPCQGTVEGARHDSLLWGQVPHVLRRLPATDRVAAIELWLALHCDIRLAGDFAPISDERLSGLPSLADRSVGYIRKGLRVLAAMGLIEIRASGSRRDVRIIATLASGKRDHFVGGNKKVDARSPAPTIKPHLIVPSKPACHAEPLPIGWATEQAMREIPGYRLVATKVIPKHHPGNG